MILISIVLIHFKRSLSLPGWQIGLETASVCRNQVPSSLFFELAAIQWLQVWGRVGPAPSLGCLLNALSHSFLCISKENKHRFGGTPGCQKSSRKTSDLEMNLFSLEELLHAPRFVPLPAHCWALSWMSCEKRVQSHNNEFCGGQLASPVAVLSSCPAELLQWRSVVAASVRGQRSGAKAPALMWGSPSRTHPLISSSLELFVGGQLACGQPSLQSSDNHSPLSSFSIQENSPSQWRY